MKQILVPAACSLAVAGSAVTALNQMKSDDPVATQLWRASQGMTAYALDFDNALPLAQARDEKGWRSPLVVRVPAVEKRDEFVFANAVKPYWKDKDVLKLEGPTKTMVPMITTGDSIGVAYNGLLHQLKLDAIEHRHIVPMLWTPFGKSNRYGSVGIPQLRCDESPKPCVFSPEMKTNVFGGRYEDIETYDKGMVYVADAGLGIKRVRLEVHNKADWQHGIYYTRVRQSPDGEYHVIVAPDEKTKPSNAPLFFAPNRIE